MLVYIYQQVHSVWKYYFNIVEGVLPPTFTSLNAKAIVAGNQINWVTAEVVNVKY